MKLDGATLQELTELCFDLSMDGRLTQEQRDRFLAIGRRLRLALRDLLAAVFSAGTAEVLAANQRLLEVNQRLKDVQRELQDVAEAIEQASMLVGQLAELLASAPGLF